MSPEFEGADAASREGQTDALDRYDALETYDGTTVVYDEDVPTAWLRSDEVVYASAER
jgi:hypothetical protein